MLDSKLQKAVYPASTRITDEKRRQLQRTKQDFFNSESGDTSYSFAITYMQGNDPIIGPEEKETTVFQLNPNQLEIDDPNTHFMVWSHGNDTYAVDCLTGIHQFSEHANLISLTGDMPGMGLNEGGKIESLQEAAEVKLRSLEAVLKQRENNTEEQNHWNNVFLRGHSLGGIITFLAAYKAYQENKTPIIFVTNSLVSTSQQVEGIIGKAMGAENKPSAKSIFDIFGLFQSESKSEQLIDKVQSSFLISFKQFDEIYKSIPPENIYTFTIDPKPELTSLPMYQQILIPDEIHYANTKYAIKEVGKKTAEKNNLLISYCLFSTAFDEKNISREQQNLMDQLMGPLMVDSEFWKKIRINLSTQEDGVIAPNASIFSNYMEGELKELQTQLTYQNLLGETGRGAPATIETIRSKISKLNESLLIVDKLSYMFDCVQQQLFYCLQFPTFPSEKFPNMEEKEFLRIDAEFKTLIEELIKNKPRIFKNFDDNAMAENILAERKIRIRGVSSTSQFTDEEKLLIAYANALAHQVVTIKTEALAASIKGGHNLNERYLLVKSTVGSDKPQNVEEFIQEKVAAIQLKNQQASEKKNSLSPSQR